MFSGRTLAYGHRAAHTYSGALHWGCLQHFHVPEVTIHGLCAQTGGRAGQRLAWRLGRTPLNQHYLVWLKEGFGAFDKYNNHWEFGGFAISHCLCRGPGRLHQRESSSRVAGFIWIRIERVCWGFQGKEAAGEGVSNWGAYGWNMKKEGRLSDLDPGQAPCDVKSASAERGR